MKDTTNARNNKYMLLGIISFMWTKPFTNKNLGLVDRAASLGFEAFELVMPDLNTTSFDELGEQLRAKKMASSLTARVDSHTDPCSEDASIRQNAQRYLRHCIDAASQMGASIVGGPLLGSPLVFASKPPRMLSQQQREQRFAYCVQHLSELAPYAQERKVKLAIEPVNRFETDVINLVEQALELIDAIDGKDVLGVLLDTFHANIEEESIIKAIKTAGARLLHVHANENHRGMIGTGHIHWPSIMQALEAIGYHGQIIMEPFRRHDNRFSVPLATWRPPQPEEDHQVAKSLHYLKSLLKSSRRTKA